MGINRKGKTFLIIEPAPAPPSPQDLGHLPQCHGLWSCLVSPGDQSEELGIFMWLSMKREA